MEGLASGGSNRLPQAFIDAQFKPGQSGNQLGRKLEQHTLAAYIRSKTLEGVDLVDFLISVMGGANAQFAKMKDRVEACALLLDRGWGKAPQTITFEKDSQNRPLLDLTKLSPAEFEQFKNLALKIAPIAVEADSEPKSASTIAPESTISPPHDPNIKP